MTQALSEDRRAVERAYRIERAGRVSRVECVCRRWTGAPVLARMALLLLFAASVAPLGAGASLLDVGAGVGAVSSFPVATRNEPLYYADADAGTDMDAGAYGRCAGAYGRMVSAPAPRSEAPYYEGVVTVYGSAPLTYPVLVTESQRLEIAGPLMETLIERYQQRRIRVRGRIDHDMEGNEFGTPVLIVEEIVDARVRGAR